MAMDEVDRVVFDHFPVEKLPEEVREQLRPGADLRLIVEQRFDDAGERPSINSILEAMRPYRRSGVDAVERVRALRAEWDHRDQLIERIRRGDAG
jgi:hypothetical protein